MKRIFGAALLVAGAGLLFITAKRRRNESRRVESGREREEDMVGLASDDSFPASDPPSFTPLGGSQTGVAGGLR